MSTLATWSHVVQSRDVRSRDFSVPVCSSNEDLSNPEKGEIALASPLNSSFVLARWQHRPIIYGLATICNCMF